MYSMTLHLRACKCMEPGSEQTREWASPMSISESTTLDYVQLHKAATEQQACYWGWIMDWSICKTRLYQNHAVDNLNNPSWPWVWPSQHIVTTWVQLCFGLWLQADQDMAVNVLRTFVSPPVATVQVPVARFDLVLLPREFVSSKPTTWPVYTFRCPSTIIQQDASRIFGIALLFASRVDCAIYVLCFIHVLKDVESKETLTRARSY